MDIYPSLTYGDVRGALEWRSGDTALAIWKEPVELRDVETGGRTTPMNGRTYQG